MTVSHKKQKNLSGFLTQNSKVTLEASQTPKNLNEVKEEQIEDSAVVAQKQEQLKWMQNSMSQKYLVKSVGFGVKSSAAQEQPAA